LVLRQCPLAVDPVCKILPLDKIHDQVGIAPLLEKVTNADEVGVVQASENLCLLPKLATELGQGFGVHPGLGKHLLQRDLHIEPCVRSLINCSHSSLAHQGDNSITVL
jgi:hypothetical protein